MIFTFMQMYYLFMHSRLNINKNKIMAKFGLMHLLATNCCIWIRTLVRESVREITESEEFEGLADEAIKTRFRGHGANVTREEQGDCLKIFNDRSSHHLQHVEECWPATDFCNG